MASTSPLAPERPSSTAPVETEEWSHDSLERIVAEIQQEFPDPAVQQASSQDSGAVPVDATVSSSSPLVKVDIWRDTSLRFLGYANEVGEGFRPIVPQLVLPSYGIAVAYVLADTVSKYQGASARQAEAASSGEATPSPSHVAIDTLTWQTFASVLVPGLAINRTVWFVKQAVEAAPSRLPDSLPLKSMLANPTVRRWLPTVVGLATIPLIIHPIDEFVHRQMDRTVRKWLGLPTHFVWH